MPATSGYELLVAAGSSLSGTGILDSDEEPSDGDVAQFLNANAEALAQARSALRRDCAVPLEYEACFFEKQCENYPPLRNLARSFALELNAAKRRGDLSRAVDIGWNLFDLANAVRRGGLVVDLLVAVALEGISIDVVRRLHRKLGAADAIRLANGLLKCDASREPFDDVVARDNEWEEAVNYTEDDTDSRNMESSEAEGDGIDEETQQEIAESLQSLARSPDRVHEVARLLDHRNLAMLRLLALESALIAFHARHGAYPGDVSNLAPDCVVSTPRDPFTGGRFKYRNTDDGFMVYSPGPTGQDSGGNYGGWFSVLSGQADLGVDMADYEDSCCAAGARPRSSHVWRRF